MTRGFLGTGASMQADLTLVAYILLIAPGMIAGFWLARRKMFVPHHKLVMTTIVLVNWFLIFYVMVNSYSLGVAPKLPGALPRPFYLNPTIHLVLGLSAQLLGTILVIRMWFENQLPQALRFPNIKFWMRLTLVLWLVTVAFGVITYLTWYVPPFKQPF